MAWLSLKNAYNDHIASVDRSYAEQDFQKRQKPVEYTKLDVMKKAAAKQLDQEGKELFQAYVKREILREEPVLTSSVTADICSDCGTYMVVIANDSMLACCRCAKTRIITSANAWSASMDVDFSNINNHQKSRLLEWLEFVQAKEYGEIPEDTLKIIMEAIVSSKATGLEPYVSVIAKERQENGPYMDSDSSIARLKDKIPNIEALLKGIDSICVRNHVRSTSVKRFGERSAKVASCLSGFFPERLNADQEEYIRRLFLAASPTYDKYRKTSQPTWPGGYAYFLRCLMILLGWDEIAANFPIQLTGRNAEREEMRKEIWKILQWEYVPSSGPQKPIRLPSGKVLDGSLITESDQRCKYIARGYDEL